MSAALDPMELSPEHPCPYCGGDLFEGIYDVFHDPETGGEQLAAAPCCYDAQLDPWSVLDGYTIQDPADPDDAGAKTWAGAVGALVGRDVSRVFAGGDLSYHLEVEPVVWARAKAFVADHHAHHDPPAGWKWGFGVWNGARLVGVAMVGRPVSRRLDDGNRLEVTRLCVAGDKLLRHNAASKLYGTCAREARRRGARQIITYTLESEDGGSLRAAGWTPAARSRGGSWSRRGRKRADKAPTVPKVRWERDL